MFATQVILCVTIVGNAALFAVVLKERPSLVRTVFALYAVSIAGWAFAIYLNLFLQSLLVESWIFAIAAGTLTTQVWFAKIFPDGKVPARLGGYWPIAIGCFFMAANFYPGALFNSITIHPQGYTILDNGFLSGAYSLFALAYVCAPIIILFRKYRAARQKQARTQLRYLTIGFSLFAIIAVLANSVLPVFFHIYTFNAIGPAFSLVFASAAFYIIWKYGFLDIRKAVQRGFTYSFLIVCIVAAYELLLMLVDHDFSFRSDLVSQLSAATVTVAGILTIPFIERHFQKLTDRIFFKGRYDYALALESLSGILNTASDFNELVGRMENSLATILRAESVEIMLSAEKNSAHDLRERYNIALAHRDILIEPIDADEKHIGDILVKERRSGDRYRNEDAQLLRTFALQASTALARARLFMQVQKHALELEGKVAERTEELRKAREGERQMMLDIAHGLQTPLTVFRTKLELSGSPNAREFEHTLTALSDLIDKLLKLAHLEYVETFTFEDCSLSVMVRDICDEIGTIAESHRINVIRDIAPDILVRADTKELRTALMNLAGNAVKYMRQDGPRNITIRLAREGDNARLSVEDTGVGIAASDLAHIFDRFYRADRSGIGGSGLGLSISKKIVEHHGGTISIESTLGKGTIVDISLPALPQRE